MAACHINCGDKSCTLITDRSMPYILRTHGRNWNRDSNSLPRGNLLKTKGNVSERAVIVQFDIEASYMWNYPNLPPKNSSQRKRKSKDLKLYNAIKVASGLSKRNEKKKESNKRQKMLARACVVSCLYMVGSKFPSMLVGSRSIRSCISRRSPVETGCLQ